MVVFWLQFNNFETNLVNVIVVKGLVSCIFTLDTHHDIKQKCSYHTSIYFISKGILLIANLYVNLIFCSKLNSEIVIVSVYDYGRFSDFKNIKQNSGGYDVM